MGAKLNEDIRKRLYDWTEDFRHGECFAWGIVHGCTGCPVWGSKEDCPTKDEMIELEKGTMYEGLRDYEK